MVAEAGRNLEFGASIVPVAPNSYERFDKNGDFTGEETRQRLRRFIKTLYEWTEGLQRAGLTGKAATR